MELIGRRFGHIRIVDLLGQGGMGDVYAGVDEALHRRVALKVLHAGERLEAESRERLIQEARALSKLDHPNICRIYDYLEGGDVDLLVLERIDGVTLQEKIAAGMSRAEKLRVAASIAEVLVATHRMNIIHRDLKPENIMLTTAGEVKVLDFGLARWRATPSDRRSAAFVTRQPKRDEDEPWWSASDGLDTTAVIPLDAKPDTSTELRVFATAAGVTLGTPLYMSPEQARGESRLTPASDMYSFGLLLRLLFSGREAHPPGLTGREVILRAARGETLPMTHIDRDVASLLTRLLQIAPSDRPTAAEALRRIQLLIEKPKRIARRAAVAAVVVLFAFGVWRYMADLRRERSAAVQAVHEAVQRRAQAETLINFMLGDLRGKLEPVGRLDILDDVAERALAYITSIRPEMMGAGELASTAKALTQLGEVRIAQGKLAESLPLFEQSLVLAQSALRKEPKHEGALFALGTAHFWVGEAHRLRNEPADALLHMRRYLTVSEQLVREHPEKSDYRIELAYGFSNVGSLLEEQGRFAEALEQYERCVTIKQQRLDRDPSNADWRADLAVTVNKVGWVLQKSGALTAAREQFERERGIYAALVSASPRHAYWRERLANSHAFLASVLLDLGDLESSKQHYREEIALESELVTLDPENVSWQRNLGFAHGQLGNLERIGGDERASAKLLARADELLSSVVAREPSRTSWQRELAAVRIQRARVLFTSGDRAAATALLGQSTTALEAMPLDAATRFVLADLNLAKGDLAAAANDPVTALRDWKRAYDVLELRDSTPRATDRRLRASLLTGQLDEARALAERLDRIGYRNPELTAFRARISKS